MIPYKSHRPTALPKTLEARLEIMKAIGTLAAQHEDEQLRRRAEIASIRRELEEIAQDLRKLCREWPSLVRSELGKAGFDPNEPRVPKHNPGGGEWTTDGVQVAAGPGRSGYPIDLRDDEGFGHAIERHVGKSNEYLLSRLRSDTLAIQRRGDTAEGLTEAGSFPSLEAANKLVNSTLSARQDEVDLVATGQLQRAELYKFFDSPTGYEAYAKNERSQPEIRDTDGVYVVIIYDRDSPRVTGFLRRIR